MAPKKVLRKLKEKDQKMFEEVYNQYYKLVFYVIYSKISNYEDSRDLASDTFLSLMNSIDSIDPKKNLKFYIITIAKNLSIKYLNEKNHIVNDEEKLERLSEDKEDNKYKNYDDMISIIKNKCGLKEEEIELLVYKTKFNLKFREIAEIYNETTFQVSSRYKRLMDKIKKNIKEDDLYE